MNSDNGILAIWNTCAVGQEVHYETWYQTEHLFERLSISGIQRGRRYEAVDGGNRFFTYYETDSPGVLASDAYLQRVNHPTPMTREIMQEAFTDMSRTVCEQQLVLGRMRGVFAATIQLLQLPEEAELRRWMALNGRNVSIARVECWRAAGSVFPASTETRIRGGDKQISACLFVETLRAADCHAALDQLIRDFSLNEIDAGLYRLLCELES